MLQDPSRPPGLVDPPAYTGYRAAPTRAPAECALRGRQHSPRVAYPAYDWLRIIGDSIAARHDLGITDSPDEFSFSGAHSEALKAEQLLAYVILQIMRFEARTPPEDVLTFREDIALVIRERLTGVEAPVVTSHGHLAGILIEVNCYEPTTLPAYRLPVGWDRDCSVSRA